MHFVAKAGDLVAQLVCDPWALLRGTTHSKYGPEAQALPDPGSTGREGMWLQIAWQAAWSFVRLGRLWSLPSICYTAKCGPKGSMRPRSGSRLLWGAEPEASSPGEPRPAYPPKVRMLLP